MLMASSVSMYFNAMVVSWANGGVCWGLVRSMVGLVRVRIWVGDDESRRVGSLSWEGSWRCAEVLGRCLGVFGGGVGE
jgi:hypothetical protein